jgi:photosystem II stability/assembly factor-like uncharacterized protein
MRNTIPIKNSKGWLLLAGVALTIGARVQADPPPSVSPSTPQWEQSGWGGGGFYWAAAFHPTKSGVIYMGGDVAGVYKTSDHGRSWRMINKGLANYGVYSLAVDRTNPQTVYAATEGGLCKSTDAGEHWQLLPHTGRKELRITGERNRSLRSIAVDPTNGNIVYAGSPAGKLYKSSDGGQNWVVVYDTQSEQQTPAKSGGDKSELSSILSVAVAPRNPSTILAITQSHGLILTRDAGKNWKPVQTPARASAAAFDPSNLKVIYAGLAGQGIGKSTDGGLTWNTVSEGLAKNASFRELVVSPANSQDVYAVAASGWTGYFYASHDGGKSWKNSSSLKTDTEGNPTLPAESPTGSIALSTPTNLAMNPLNPGSFSSAPTGGHVGVRTRGRRGWNEIEVLISRSLPMCGLAMAAPTFQLWTRVRSSAKTMDDNGASCGL